MDLEKRQQEMRARWRPNLWHQAKWRRVYYIYGLVNPKTNEVFYIGCTQDLAQRLSAHCSKSNHLGHSGRRVKAYVRSLGQIPKTVILERTENPHREMAWIEYFSVLGILNTAHNPSP